MLLHIFKGGCQAGLPAADGPTGSAVEELLHSESVATADLLRRVHATLAVHRPRNLIPPGVWEVIPPAPTTCRKTARMRAAAGGSSGVMESDGGATDGESRRHRMASGLRLLTSGLCLPILDSKRGPGVVTENP